MMNKNDFDTKNLWKSFNSLLNFLVAVAVIGALCILLQKPLLDFLDQPSYTDEQLADWAKKSQKLKLQAEEDNWDLVKKGIHVRTGLKADKDLQIIIGSCTSCHSAKLITQNRATRQGWKTMIDWMQETQGLQDLGTKEPIILNYLAKYYAPEETGRRANLDLTEVEWYILKLDEED